MADAIMYNTPDVSTYVDSMMHIANQNNMWSAEQAQKQMDFQREMSNTAHQREMADLKAAGLNPILSAKSGATSPSGAMANFDSGVTNAIGQILTKVLDIQADNAKANLVAEENEANNSGSGSGSGSGYGYTSGSYEGTAKDLNGYDVKGITGLPLTLSNALASGLNWLKNINVDATAKQIDDVGKKVANTIAQAKANITGKEQSNVPPKGTSAYKAYEYQKNTGTSPTKNGLSVGKTIVNKVAGVLKGFKK